MFGRCVAASATPHFATRFLCINTKAPGAAHHTSCTRGLPPRCAALQELEARLLQTEREKDSVRAQLHELQLSIRTEGEFGNAGRRLRWAATLGATFRGSGQPWICGMPTERSEGLVPMLSLLACRVATP